MPYDVTAYDFEYDDEILVCDEINKMWRKTWFDHIENGKVVNCCGLSWDYAIPYYEHLKGKEMEESDLCL